MVGSTVEPPFNPVVVGSTVEPPFNPVTVDSTVEPFNSNSG